jgi:hypothetical protein
LAKKLSSHGSSSLPLWGTKAFPDEEAAEGLRWLFPNAKFIYVYRNGIDVVFSMSKFHSFTNLTFEARCKFWANHSFRYEFLRNHESSLAIRFEDLVQDPEETISKMCAHLNVPIESAPLELVSENLFHPLDGPNVLANPKVVLGSRQPAYTTWSAEDRELFRSICKDAMALLNYEIPF